MKNGISKKSTAAVWIMGIIGIAFVILVASILLFTSTKEIFADAIFI